MAGTGTSGYNGDDIAATGAQLRGPSGVTIDAFGNLYIYIADSGNRRVRRVTPAGIITTVAGTGTPGYNGDNIPATNAQLRDPNAVTLDAFGNLYVADTGNNRVRRVAAGIITTVAGTGIPGYNGDNIVATEAQLRGPDDMAIDAAGRLYIADTGNDRIRRVASDGIITSLAGTTPWLILGVLRGGYNGDGGPAAAAQLNAPSGVVVDTCGSVYVADSRNNRIRILAPEAPGCTITLEPPSVRWPGFGGDLRLRVNTFAPGCRWTTGSDFYWLAGADSPIRTGGAVSMYPVGANPATLERSGTIRVSGRISSVTQEGLPPGQAPH